MNDARQPGRGDGQQEQHGRDALMDRAAGADQDQQPGEGGEHGGQGQGETEHGRMVAPGDVAGQETPAEWAGAVPFVTMVQSAVEDGRAESAPWGDEFLAWYRPGAWLGEHRACAVWLGMKVRAMVEGEQADRCMTLSDDDLRSLIERDCGPVQRISDMLWAVAIARAAEQAHGIDGPNGEASGGTPSAAVNCSAAGAATKGL